MTSPQLQAAMRDMSKAVEAATQATNDLLIHTDGATRDRGQMLVQAAIGRLREAGLLFQLACDKPFSFQTHFALDSLKNVLHTTHALANDEVSQMGPGGELVDIDEVESLLEDYEAAMHALTQGEIASSCALLHLHTALTLVDTKD